MEMLLILTYAAICIAVFKLFKIPLNKWSVPTAVLGGIVLIGTLLMVMNYNHPYAPVSRKYYVTTPIVPGVSGLVTEVYVAEAGRVDRNDTLFRIDPLPFGEKVTELEARLELATMNLKRAQGLAAKQLAAQVDVDRLTTEVDSISAQLARARWELSQTDVRAPGDGQVVQIAIRPGVMAAAIPLRPVMIFIPDDEEHIVGWFHQNSRLRLQPGFMAEVTFDAIPGKVFEARVERILGFMAEGQVQPSGDIISPLTAPQPGLVPVVVEVIDADYAGYRDQVTGGSYAAIAVYSDHFVHLGTMRKILLRMGAWLSYLFPFH